jgi:hypothetical protein
MLSFNRRIVGQSLLEAINQGLLFGLGQFGFRVQ